MKKKIVIIGGVAGGANVATRARRLSETAEIVMVERSGYVSFANCGLPYHLGGEIADRSKLLLHTPATLRARYNIDARIHTEAIAIDTAAQRVTMRELTSGRIYEESYDDLVLAMGAQPMVPQLPGIASTRVMTLRNIEEMDRIQAALGERPSQRVTVVGGGFIGVEVAEQLAHCGHTVTLLESNPQVLTPFDPEMAVLLSESLATIGVHLKLGMPLREVREHANGLEVIAGKNDRHVADLVVLVIGIRPASEIAREAGITCGSRGGVLVDQELRTSAPHVWAVGDVIEITNLVSGEVGPIPLAGPANRQGRLVADNIFGAKKTFPGAIGTAIVRVGELTAAMTGINEKTAKRLERHYKTLYLSPNSHAGYYPGAAPLTIKVIIDPLTRTLLGAQIIGRDGVDKRIDVLATAIKAGLTVDDIADLELAYAPPYSSAKDPVNLVGMAAQNLLDGLVEVVAPGELDGLVAREHPVLLDVREPDEVAKGAIPDSLHIPLGELRRRLAELPRARPYVVYCASSQRSYYAARLLSLQGFQVLNLTGAYTIWHQFQRMR